jgi:hypothetical protein
MCPCAACTISFEFETSEFVILVISVKTYLFFSKVTILRLYLK